MNIIKKIDLTNNKKIDLAFVIFSVLSLIPIWVSDYFPSVDGPAHVGLVHVWRHLNDPNFQLFSDFFETSPRLYPNMFIYWLLYFLFNFFSPFVSEKILLSFFVISLPLSVRFLVSAFKKKLNVAILLVFPFSYNFITYFGFFNFLFGSIFFCITFRFWLDFNENLSMKKLFLFSISSILSYYSHFTSVCFLIFAIGIVLLYDLCGIQLFNKKELACNYNTGIWFKKTLLTICALLPVLLFSISFFLSLTTSSGNFELSSVNFSPVPLSRFFDLIEGKFLYGLSSNSRLFGSIYIVTILLLVVAISTMYRKNICLKSLLLSSCFLILFLLVPFKMQLMWVPYRTSLYLFIMLIYYMSMVLAKRNQDHFDNLDKLIFIISAVMIYYSTVVRTTDHLISNIYYKEYFSGTHLIKKNSTLMSIRVVGPMPDSDGYSTFHKLLQGGSYFMALNSVVDVKHVQAHSAMVPVRFKDEMDSYKHWFTDSELVSSIPQMSLPGLETFSNKKLDYLLVWGPLKDALKIKGYGKIVHQLLQKIEKNFNLIHISRPYGYLHLYEHK